MSTNYYFHKEPYGRRHIGKTYWGGPDRGTCFTWAIRPAEFEVIIARFGPDVEVRDGSKQMTLREFCTEVLTHVKQHETEYVGTEFS